MNLSLLIVLFVVGCSMISPPPLIEDSQDSLISDLPEEGVVQPEEVVFRLSEDKASQISGQISEISSRIAKGSITRKTGAELLNYSRLSIIGSNPMDDHIFDVYSDLQTKLDARTISFSEYQLRMKEELSRINTPAWKKRQGFNPPYFSNYILKHIYFMPEIGIYRAQLPEGILSSERTYSADEGESFALPQLNSIKGVDLKPTVPGNLERDQPRRIVPVDELSIKPIR